MQRHNSWERTNQLLCHLKGETALIAFRARGWASLAVSYLKLGFRQITFTSVLWLSFSTLSVGWLSMFVCLSLRGGGRARERVQCRNQLLAQMFMGRWSFPLQAETTSPKYHTLCLSSGIYLSPSYKSGFWQSECMGLPGFQRIVYLPIHEILLPFLEYYKYYFPS